MLVDAAVAASSTNSAHALSSSKIIFSKLLFMDGRIKVDDISSCVDSLPFCSRPAARHTAFNVDRRSPHVRYNFSRFVFVPFFLGKTVQIHGMSFNSISHHPALRFLDVRSTNAFPTVFPWRAHHFHTHTYIFRSIIFTELRN